MPHEGAAISIDIVWERSRMHFLTLIINLKEKHISIYRMAFDFVQKKYLFDVVQEI